ncbi:THO complex subunit 2 [Geranomyces variabilis]|nr:THO complex subunit 2 [Geranomyces variabilis]
MAHKNNHNPPAVSAIAMDEGSDEAPEYITSDIIAAWDRTGSARTEEAVRKLLSSPSDAVNALAGLRSLVLELFFAGLQNLVAVTSIATFFSKMYRETAPQSASTDAAAASSYVGPSELADPLTLPSVLVDTMWLLDQQTQPTDDGVPPERTKLLEIVKSLISKNFIPEIILRERLEIDFQAAVGLINDPKGLAKKEVRMRTSMLYVQTKYNLLREEPEGFSKLVTELFRNLPPLFDCHEPSHGGARLTKEEATKRRAAAVEERAQVAMQNIRSLIGYFDLDPNRVLDLILDSFTANIADHWDFFVRLLEISPWRAKGSTKEPMSMCGQILGFKFDWYRGPTSTKKTPEALIFVAAVMIKHGLVSLSDLYPHLSIDDIAVEELYTDLCKEQRKRQRTAGRFKGLQLSGSLGDDGNESTAAAAGLAPVVETKTEIQREINQKAEIAAALIAIGDFKNGFVILERLPKLVHLHPEIADNICRFLRIIIADWDPKPAAAATRLPRHAPEDYRPGANTISVRLAPVFDRVNVGRRESSPKYKFFYHEWTAEKPTVRNVAELCTRIRMYLVHVGRHLHRDPILVAQLIRIGALHVSECKKRQAGVPSQLTIPHPEAATECFDDAKHEATVNGWLNIVINYLLPANSIAGPNPANSQGLWTIIKQFPYEKRFALYGEWKNRLYDDNPEMELARAGCERDCRYILSRLNKESAKQSGRQIGKVLHSNPVIAFSYIITRLEAYDNMIPYVVDATRYLTDLEFDILPYCLIDALAVAKSKVQRNGLNISDWLKSLGSFTGQAFKKHPMDLEPLLRYMTNQLCSGNLHDLHILQEVIGTMSGVKVTEDVTEAQLEAMAGSDTLKREAFFWEPMRTTRKAGTRLMKALVETGYAKKLAILISQRKQEVTYLSMGSEEEDNVDVKILAWLNDYCQRTLAQFLDFLSVITPPDGYAAAMPEIGELVTVYGLHPEQAFLISRAKLATYVKHKDYAAVAPADTDVKPPTKSASTDVAADSQDKNPNAMQIDGPANGVDVDGQKGQHQLPPTSRENGSDAMDVDAPPDLLDFKSNRVWQEGLHSTIEAVIPILPAAAWRGITPMFYVTFWQLSLHDIFFPAARYSAEITSQKNTLRDLEREITKLTQMHGVNEDIRKKRKEVERIQIMIKTLESESRIHEAHHGKVMQRLRAESAHWFESSTGRPETTQMILQYCLQPRCVQSPADAVFCAKFILLIHNLGSPFVPTVTLYDKIFTRDVIHATVFASTEDEIKNFGLFLATILKTLTAWHHSATLFNKEAIGADLPGFLKRWPTGLIIGKMDLKTTDFVSHGDFTLVHRKWHLKLTKAIEACIMSGEYMQIRNAIYVLDKVNDYYPVWKQMGELIEIKVKEMLAAETREDLKQLARSVYARVGAKAKTWIKNLERSNSGIAQPAPSKATPAPAPLPVTPRLPASLPPNPGHAARSGLSSVTPDRPPLESASSTPSAKRERETVKPESASSKTAQTRTPGPANTKDDDARERGEIGEIRRVKLEPRSAPDSRRSRESSLSAAPVKPKESSGISTPTPAASTSVASTRTPATGSGSVSGDRHHHGRDTPRTPLPKIPGVVVREKPAPARVERERHNGEERSSVLSNDTRNRANSDVENASPPSSQSLPAAEPPGSAARSREPSAQPAVTLTQPSASTATKERSEKDSRKEERRPSGHERKDRERGRDSRKDRDRKRKERLDDTASDDKKDRKRDRGEKDERESKRSRQSVSEEPNTAGSTSGATSSGRKRHAEDDAVIPPGGMDSYRPGSSSAANTPGSNKRPRESPRERDVRDRDDRESRKRRSSGRQ